MLRRAMGFGLFLLVGLAGETIARPGLEACAPLFPDGRMDQAPAYQHSDDKRDLLPVCKHIGDWPVYAAGYDGQRRVPAWVAYRVTERGLGTDFCRASSRRSLRDLFGSASRDPFRRDRDVPWRYRVTHRTYTRSGFQRGHLVPAASFAGAPCAWYATFSMANIVPQFGAVNRGPWLAVERLVRRWVRREKSPLLVYAGPLYRPLPQWSDRLMGATDPSDDQCGPPNLTDDTCTVRAGQCVPDEKGPARPCRGEAGEVEIPIGFFKILYDPIRHRAMAFAMPNRAIDDKPLGVFVTAIGAVESASGLRFSLPGVDREALEDNWLQGETRSAGADRPRIRWWQGARCPVPEPLLRRDDRERRAFCSAAWSGPPICARPTGNSEEPQNSGYAFRLLWRPNQQLSQVH